MQERGALSISRQIWMSYSKHYGGGGGAEESDYYNG